MEPNKKSNGALIGSIIIVLVLIIGGMYVFKVTKKNYQAQQDAKQLENIQEEDMTVQSLGQVNSSNDLDAIDQDLEATDFSGLEVQ